MSATRVFGVSLALALLINALVSVGAAVAAIDTSRADLGPADLIVRQGGGSASLSSADFAAVAQDLSAQAALGPLVSGTQPITAGAQQLEAQIQGVPPNYPSIFPWQTDQGRFLSAVDDANLDPVAVIDERLAQQLFPTGNAVGSTIHIATIPFTIVGVGSDNLNLQSGVVLVPFRTAQIRLFGPTALGEIAVRLAPGADALAVSRETEALLRNRHNLRAGQPDDFTVSTVDVSSPASLGVTGTRVLQVIQQFVCPAKNTCPRSAA